MRWEGPLQGAGALPGGAGLSPPPSCVQLQLQMFDIACSTSWAGRDRCCELPGLVSAPGPLQPRPLGAAGL